MKNKILKPKWFTLVEMLIVVVIIWILAATLIPRLLWAQSQARDAARNKNMRDIASWLEIYYNNVGSYPGLQFVWTPFQYIGCADQLTWELEWIMSNIPKDPQKQHKNYWKDPRSSEWNRNWKSYCVWEYNYVPSNYNWQLWSWGLWFSTGWASFAVTANMENIKNSNLVLFTDDWTTKDPYLWREAEQSFYSDAMCEGKIKLTSSNSQLELNKYYNNWNGFASPWSLAQEIRTYSWWNSPICETKDINRIIKMHFSTH